MVANVTGTSNPGAVEARKQECLAETGFNTVDAFVPPPTPPTQRLQDASNQSNGRDLSLVNQTAAQTLLRRTPAIAEEAQDPQKPHPTHKRGQSDSTIHLGITNRDILFNNRRKVLYEIALAALILKNKLLLLPAIHKVAKHSAVILKKTLFNLDNLESNTIDFGKVKTALLDTINDLSTKQEFNKANEQPENTTIKIGDFKKFQTWALTTLNSEDSRVSDAQLALIYLYAGFVTRPDRLGIKGISELGELPVCLFIDNTHQNILIEGYNQHKNSSDARIGTFINGSSASRKSQAKSRINIALTAENKGLTKLEPHNNLTSTIGGITPGQGLRKIALKEDYHVEDVNNKNVQTLIMSVKQHTYETTACGIHQPQTAETLREDHKGKFNDFYGHSVWHDLPLIGGASGGAGVYEMMAKTLNALSVNDTDKLTDKEIVFYRLAVVGSFISKGYHSLHEICTIQKLFGSPYQPGNYESILPSEVTNLEDYASIKKEFTELFKDNSQLTDT